MYVPTAGTGDRAGRVQAGTHRPEWLAHIIYRATHADRINVEIRFYAAPETATVADAWARLSALCGQIDPLTLEIEIWEVDEATDSAEYISRIAEEKYAVDFSDCAADGGADAGRGNRYGGRRGLIVP
jgi:hypothetical protein